MKKLLLLVVALFFGVSLVFAQTKQIRGTVTSSDDGMPIPGVSVAIKGTTTGTTTDLDGNFTLTVPANEILVFSFVGMKRQDVPVTDATVYDIKLVPDVIGVDEVMVVAYGTAKKESFTGSAGVVDNEVLQKRPVADISKALEGQIAGVQTTSGTGQPGEGAEIIIRGFGSINSSNNPLYVVDGVPFDGNLNSINPGDIESMTILKDASAGALYGSRGANGVVVITTKKGQSKELSVELKATYGFSSRAIKPYETLSTADFIEASFQGYKNALIYTDGVHPDLAGPMAVEALRGGTGIFGANEMYNPYNMPVSQLIDPQTGQVNPSAKLLYESDWLDEVTNDNATRQEYQLFINGGSDNSKVYASLAYLKDEGLLKTTDFERISGRIGAELTPKNWFKYGGNINFSKTETTYLGYDGTTSNSNVWYSAQFMAPIYPVYVQDENGNPILSETGKKQYDYGLTRPAGANPNWNPVATLFEDAYETTADNLSGRFHLNLLGLGLGSSFDGLSFTTNVGFDYINTNQTVYWNPEFGNAANIGGYLDKTNTRTLSYTINQLLRYEKDFGKHSINVLAGHEFYKLTMNEMEGSKSGFPYAGIKELAPGSTTSGLTSFEDNYSIESFLSNVTYDFSDKYYLSASFRTDGSSRFHKDYRWGNFWSVGGSWRISEEGFMEEMTFIDNLKLKASYGKQGNDNIGTYYGWQSLYNLDWANANLNGALLSSLENTSIKWEENNNFNVGVDAVLFERFDISFEYYRRRTVDMLMEKPMATSLGFDSYWANVGEMLNTGFEFNANLSLITNPNLVWNANLNLTSLTNEIVELDGETDQIVNGNTIQRKGEEINSYYLAQSAGVDAATGAQLYWVYDLDPDGEPGASYISDDYQKASQSKRISGSRIPDFYGGFGSSFKFYKNIDMSFMTTFSVGGEVYESVYGNLMNPIYIGTNYAANVERAWRKPGDVTDVPRIQNGTGFSRPFTDSQLIDASYFAIKNITVGYTLPKNILQNIGIESVRAYVAVDNLAIFSHLDGMNPQYDFSGTTDFSYTPVRTSLFGIELKF
ncbi:SusC/RagA family TonB-linked outer membrane protein [Draconibacterium halophilum]|uniref:TonB-dependent receptor n=1 Tax=Draconibacterium halophilum TaxID=2706887 RepID=A0A6C0RGZ8_9BACT|nr:TonB-dependent receptor [Draconibacterium halophilum]QIA09369.1 TonB-dependent receptor [Draconibacterium halophilum]